MARVDEFFGVVEEGLVSDEGAAEAAMPFVGAVILPAKERAEWGVCEEVGLGGGDDGAEVWVGAEGRGGPSGEVYVIAWDGGGSLEGGVWEQGLKEAGEGRGVGVWHGRSL